MPDDYEIYRVSDDRREAMTETADRCPSCESPDPVMHPATQADGGEVLYICPDPWHKDERP